MNLTNEQQLFFREKKTDLADNLKEKRIKQRTLKRLKETFPNFEVSSKF